MPITVVTGPPCSGKTTYVREHASPGDVVVDLDALAQALGSPDPHNHPPAVLHLAQLARGYLIRAVMGYKASPVWIIDTMITPEHLARYVQAGATIVSLDVDREVLHQRARDQGRPPDVHHAIDLWLAPPAPLWT